MIYLDYQASTPIDSRVREVLVEGLDDFGNPHSSEHAAGWKASALLEAARTTVATALQCDPSEMIFTSGATESNNSAVLGVCAGVTDNRSTILLAPTEHKCTLEAAIAAKSLGFNVKFLRVHRDGSLDLDGLHAALDAKVALVSVMAVHNEIGTVQDLPEICRLSHEVGALVHSDAVQLLSVEGAVDLAREVDLLSLSGHKIYGPKGIGALVVRHEAQRGFSPLLRGGGQQFGLRSGTVPVPMCTAFGRAVELMLEDDAQQERERISFLQRSLYEGLLSSGFAIQLNGPPLTRRHPGNLNLSFEGFSAHDIIASVQPKLAISSGSACSSGNLEPSHVLTGLGLSRERASGSIRFGLGRFTTQSDVLFAADLVVASLQKLRALEV